MYRIAENSSSVSGKHTSGNSALAAVTGSSNWYQNLTRSWGNALDKQAQHTANLAQELTAGDDAPGKALQVSAAAHQLSFLSTAAATASNSIGQALEVLGKKQ